MKPIKLIIFMTSMTSILILTQINIRDIPDAHASEKTVKKISDIKKVTLFIRSCTLPDDLEVRQRSTIRGMVVFEDNEGKQCAINYDGIAELSCTFFHKGFYIKPGDFKTVSWFGSDTYAYPIEFKVSFDEAPTLYRRPYETVKFRIGDFEATCELSPGGSRGSSSEQSPWKLHKGKN